MTQKFLVVSAVCVLSIIMTACGSAALPAYESAETDVAVAQIETREALVAQGEIIPTNTPTITPSPTVDFEATNAVIQATDDAIATLTAEAEAQAAAEAEAAEAEAQAAADAAAAEAEAAADAQPELFAEIEAADANNGAMLFITNMASPCSACHYADSEDSLVGPGQLNVFARVVERIEDGTIEEASPYVYLYNSIVHPNDYLTVNSSGVAYPPAMPVIYGDMLSDQDIYDLVAYLVSLEG